MFVTFEGVDGSGKSTQAERLVEWLTEQGRNVVSVREPGGTALGEELRRLVLDGGEMTPWAEAALFAAARAELVARVIRPALERGDDVVCDRYLDSSVAYQGVARGLGESEVRELSLLVTGALLPARTFVLLVDADAARSRAGESPDRIEREREFLVRVGSAYRALADHEPERMVLLDGALPPDEIEETVHEHVRPLL